MFGGTGASNCSYLPSVEVPPPAAAAAPQTQRSFDALQQAVNDLVDQSGATGAVTLVELGGDQAQTWSLDGDVKFAAASTYKLPLLMEEAQLIATGRERSSDLVCFEGGDWEDGWYTDYQPGSCYTRSELMRRIGQNSDNTAAHMLVRDEGWTEALNEYASQHGAGESDFYYPNLTTSNDLARLLANEASGGAGGKGAQARLYPLLTHTAYEDGVPAGVPDSATVVHKVGILDDALHDAALVQGGPRGAYVVAICTQGVGGEPGWKLVADISRAVWQFESAR
jgi:beta-lactamase class A